jgi:hypothetical protein
MEQKLEGLEQDLGGRRSMVKVMNGGALKVLPV